MLLRCKYYLFLPLLLIIGNINSVFGQETIVDSAWVISTYNYLLMLEADSGNIEKVKTLLYLGADPNTCDENGVTPLMFAVQSGNAELVELLIDAGANVNAYPANGNTALHAAVIAANDTITELLIKKGANVNAKNVKGLTPLHYAVWLGLPYLTDILIYYGSNINPRDNLGNTPVMLSVFSGAKLSTRLLLENGANPNIPDNKGVTPLMVAAQFNDTIICNYLTAYGADLSLKDKRGANALSYAIANNSSDIIKILIDLDALDYTLKKSYYQIAREYNNKEAMLLFAKQGHKTKIKLSISTFNFGMGITLANHEFLLGFRMGITEQITQTELSIAFLYRPNATASLTSVNGQLYQYWEYRKIIQANINKNYNLLKHKGKNINAFANLGIGPAFRNFRGTESKPKTFLSTNISGGLSLRGEIMEYSLAFGYNFKNELGASPYFYSISAKFHLNVLHPRVVNKNIKHVQ
ncbi:MAG TPA: ankyrin repeat domain-containing protein [Bacteroidales bacterium]|nr:ankyrin repeat domain-containing protein [Bacteroidales bacterium]